MKRLLFILALVALPAAAQTPGPAPTCEDIDWSLSVRQAYPDIAKICQGVYERGGVLYAKAVIEVTRIRGNQISFRAKHADGSLGETHRVTVDRDWRARIGGREYRASQLVPGQELNVYVPEDRFVLAMQESDFAEMAEEAATSSEAIEVLTIERTVVEMPKTASPLFTIGLAGGALMVIGLSLGVIRRTRAH
jgi:hypothetical protein